MPRDGAIVTTAQPVELAQRFQRHGDYWLVSFRGVDAYVRELKGLAYLEVLLAQPHRAVHVLELLSSPSEICAPPTDDFIATRTLSALEAYESQLDRQAAASYRQRLHELAQALDAAEACNDLGRKQLLVHESEALRAMLTAGAKARHRPTERARKAIYNCIRKAIERVERCHPTLARHLVLTIRTGAHCAYCPEHAQPWLTGPR